MNRIVKMSAIGLPLMLAEAGFFSCPAAAQAPVIVPIVVDTAAPIVVAVVKLAAGLISGSGALLEHVDH